MPLVIITVREELFPETYCWALQECMTQALRAAGWSAEPWVQKVVRLPPAELTYKPGANPDGSAPRFQTSFLSRCYYRGRGRSLRKKRSGSSSAPPLKPDSAQKSRTSYLASSSYLTKTSTTAESHHHFDCDSFQLMTPLRGAHLAI
jgi:hypothetical protein